MKVNMTPNPLDVVTIHASQGDTEARQWEFELHNNGELIDTSEITEQLFFKAYKGGTEQILPENGSTPTTSPFKGDIKYPQGLLTDQEFTYRQSPTESDGLAKITDIKGNTLVWNQLVQNGNFADESGWSFGSRTTHTVSNNECVMTAETVGNADQWTRRNIGNLYSSHKYLFLADLKGDTEFRLQIIQMSPFAVIVNRTASISSSYQRIQFIFAPTANGTGCYAYYNFDSRSNLSIKNAQIIDLTQMGIDITDPSEFTSLFPLSYYSYNQGSLLSFNGNGIKTVGKNKAYLEQGSLAFDSTGAEIASTTRVRTNFIPVEQAVDYIESSENNGWVIKNGCAYDANKNYLGYTEFPNPSTHIYNTNLNGNPFKLQIAYVRFIFGNSTNTNCTPNDYWYQFEKGTTPSSYEPYTSSTLSLPISTYFPNGMKSAGTVYDELTPRKAITRIGAVDLGTLEWGINNTDTQDIKRMKATALRNVISKPSSASAIANVVCANYKAISANASYLKTAGVAIDSGGDVLIYDPNYNQQSSTSAFKTAMSGVYLYYELATETETSFTTASLVTENAEIPLSNEDGVLIGKCTEELSAEPGFHDAKIKLSDGDGTCYSNKIQLHVERSPQ